MHFESMTDLINLAECWKECCFNEDVLIFIIEVSLAIVESDSSRPLGLAVRPRRLFQDHRGPCVSF